MSDSPPSKLTWVRHVFFTLAEHGAIRALDATTTLVLIRVMSGKTFGLFSVYQSWASLSLLLLPSLEIALYRNYAQLKSSGTLQNELGIYRSFNALKLGVSLVLVIILAFIPQPENWWTRASLLGFALALPLSQAFYGFLREPLRFEMKQHLVTLIGSTQRFALLCGVIFSTVFFPENTMVLCAIALGSYFIFAWVWSRANSLVLGPQSSSHSLKQTLHAVGKILSGTVIWIHLNGVLSQSIQTLDTFALGFFHLNLEEIGRYGVALKAANFFQLLPVALINSFGVYLGRIQGNTAKERALVKKYLLLFALLSVGLFGFGLAIEAPLLTFLGKGKLTASQLVSTIDYFRWQLAGVLIFCAIFPVSTYLGARAPLRSMFFKVFLPWACFSSAVYFYAAHLNQDLSAAAAARANVAVYVFLAIALLRQYLGLEWKQQSQNSKS